MEWPPVIALIITYRRLNLALETVRSVKEKIDYPNIGFHIADDGSPGGHVDRLCEEIGGSYSISISNSERAGVGRSMNLGMRACLARADMWLHLEDDWVLRERIDLRPCVRLLMEEENIGMVRLGRLSAGMRGQVISGADKLWLGLERNSDTYVFSGNAALRHRRFYDAYGDYKEGLPPGQTELYYCGTFNTKNGPGIVWPLWLADGHEPGGSTFYHIGDNQSFKWWMENHGLSGEEAAARFESIEQEALCQT